MGLLLEERHDAFRPISPFNALNDMLNDI